MDRNSFAGTRLLPRATCAAARQPERSRHNRTSTPIPYATRSALGPEGPRSGISGAIATGAGGGPAAGTRTARGASTLGGAEGTGDGVPGSAEIAVLRAGTETGMDMGATQYGRIGMSSMAPKTAVHAPRRRPLAGTRSATSIAPTAPATSDTRRDASTRIRTRASL